MGKFSDQIGRFNQKQQKGFRAISRQSSLKVWQIAQRVEEEGGRMRVDTGFLRASSQASIGEKPSGPVAPRKGAEKGEYVGKQVKGEPVAVMILKWTPPGDGKLFIGWTANYARAREAKDGFLQGAVERWDQIVAEMAKKASKAFG